MIAYVLLRVFVILLLVAANAFFAAAEFALVSVRETRIQQLIEARRAGARTDRDDSGTDVARAIAGSFQTVEAHDVEHRRPARGRLLARRG